MSILSPPLTGDPPSTFADLAPDRTVGSLWRRVVAALIDTLIVGAAGILIALPFFDAFSRLGGGRLFGFCLALPYYAVLNSRIGNGQTLGKRWLHLQVVDATGDPISISKSVARYAVLSLPFFLNQLTLPITRTPKVLLYLISVIIFGLGGITIYLLLFNRRTRQGTHDLAVGSYVADAEKPGALQVQPIWKGHWAVLGVLVVVGLIGGMILQSKIMKLADFPSMFADARLVEEMEDVQSVGVSDLTWTPSSGEKQKIYVVNVFWSGKRTEQENFATQVASQILQYHPQVMDRDRLRIMIIRGYDLGIAHAQVSNRFEDSPAGWQAKIEGVRQGTPAQSQN